MRPSARVFAAAALVHTATACSLLTDIGGLVGAGDERASREPANDALDAAAVHEPAGPSDAPPPSRSGDPSAGEPPTPEARADATMPDPSVVPAAIDGAGASYASVVLADGPLGYYRFGESSGAVAHDASGHGYDLSFDGVGMTWGAAGAIAGDIDTAIHSSGQGGLDAGGLFDFLQRAPFSIEGWMKLEVVDVSYRMLFIKDRYVSPTERDDVAVFVEDGAGLGFERIVDGAKLAVTTNAPSTSPPAWTYVVATFDGDRLALYVDGRLVGTRADTRAQRSKGVPAKIGCTNGPFGSVVGALDEVALYDKALPLARIQAHYARALGR